MQDKVFRTHWCSAPNLYRAPIDTIEFNAYKMKKIIWHQLNLMLTKWKKKHLDNEMQDKVFLHLHGGIYNKSWTSCKQYLNAWFQMVMFMKTKWEILMVQRLKDSVMHYARFFYSHFSHWRFSMDHYGFKIQRQWSSNLYTLDLDLVRILVLSGLRTLAVPMTVTLP